ncbi:MAG: hypothetical protein CSA66_02025 [Proteobacteria bacterium]|nr:MAG: hypothetical protein CSA66_02025 [Pseudomonadota bacterium]
MRIFKRLLVLACTLAVGVAPACDSSSGSGDGPADATLHTDTAAADTSGGDDTSTADTQTADVPSTPGTVKALQGEAQSNGCDEASILTVNPAVSVTAVVVTSPRYTAVPADENATIEGLDGYYVADQDGGPWSGINISIAASEQTNFAPGTVLDLEGELIEFYCNTQLKVTSFLEGGTVDAPAPLELDPAAVGDEQYEGMLLKVSDVSVTEEVAAGVYRVTGGFIVDYQFDFFLSMEVGKTYDVTGQLSYGFGEWRLKPRSAADVVDKTPGTATTITAIQGSAGSLTGCQEDNKNYFEDGLEVTGVITSDTFTVGDKPAFYLSDGTQDPYSGVLVYDKNAVASSFGMGDVVTLTAQHMEYHCLTELIPSAAAASATTITAPAAVPLAAGLDGDELEKYEGMLVTLSNVHVTGVTNSGEAETDAGVLIDKYIMGDAFTAPDENSTLTSVTGFLNYGFSNYRVSPRSADDLVVE